MPGSQAAAALTERLATPYAAMRRKIARCDMHVVVVGGAGYIGSHVARHLLDAGHSVTVFDNLSHGLHENLHADASFVHGDILHGRELASVLSGSHPASGGKADAVVHLAALKAAGESMVVPERYAENNLIGTITLLNAMVETGVTRIVFSSSAAVYGEPTYNPIDEAHPTRPINFYGFTKLEIERLMGWYDRLKGIRYAALRYFNAAGYDPRVRGLEQNPANLIPIIMEVCVGVRDELVIYGNDYETDDGTCIRDYIHVTDLADGHVKALGWIDANDTSVVTNLGSEKGISVREMLEAARAVTGHRIPARSGPRRPGDPATLIASSREAQQLLGWKAEHSSADELLGSSWDAYKRAHPGAR